MFETSTLETLYGGQLTLNSVKKKKKKKHVGLCSSCMVSRAGSRLPCSDCFGLMTPKRAITREIRFTSFTSFKTNYTPYLGHPGTSTP